MTQVKKLAAAIFVAAMAFAGIAAGPGDSQADPPEQAENGCRGVQEAQGDNGGDGQTDGTPAEEVLSQVADLLDQEDNDCDDHDAASGDNGRP